MSNVEDTGPKKPSAQELLRRIMYEEVSVLVTEHREELVRKSHARLRAMGVTITQKEGDASEPELS